MADTFATMYRELLQFVPNLPVFLARKLINERYRQIVETGTWSAMRAENVIVIPDAYSTGTVTMTSNSTTVTGSGTSWTAALIGQQLRVNSRGPQFTITAVGSTTSLTIEMAWPSPTASAQPYTILQAYVTMPTDFKRFIAVYDALRQWRLFFNFSVQELAGMDPARTSVGDPWLLADYRQSTAGRVLYELWPGPTVARGYQYLYIKQAADLINDTDQPIYPLQGSELVYGALADVCSWPGTAEFPNPLFERAQLHMPMFESKFRDAVNGAEREDQGTYLSWYQRPEFSTAPYAPIDSRFFQNHAIGAMNY